MLGVGGTLSRLCNVTIMWDFMDLVWCEMLWSHGLTPSHPHTLAREVATHSQSSSALPGSPNHVTTQFVMENTGMPFSALEWALA